MIDTSKPISLTMPELPEGWTAVATVRKVIHHAKCGLRFDANNGDYDCEYQTTLCCEDCKYGMGRKDPEAKCNQINGGKNVTKEK